MKLFLFFLCFLFYFCYTKKRGSCSPSATPMLPALLDIIRRSISLFILSLNSSEPYNKEFNRDSPSKRVTGGSTRQRSSWRLCLSLARNWQRKKKVFSSFNFSNTVTYGSQTVFEVMTEFKVTWVTKLHPLTCKQFYTYLVMYWKQRENNVKTALTLIWNAW